MSVYRAMRPVFLYDLAERVVSTFIQVFIATTLASVTKVMWGDVAAIALFAAFTSLLTTGLVWLGALKAILNPYVDMLYRASMTFGQTLLGYVVAAGAISALDFNWTFALKAALVATASSLLKALIGLNSPRSLGVSPLVLRPDFGERRVTDKRPLVA